MEKRIYRGWIPAVSGRLSFTVFGQTNHPTPAISENVADGQSRYLVSYQARDTADVLTPFKNLTGPALFGLDGALWFVFIAKTENEPANVDGGTEKNQEYLSGRSLIFRNRSDWEGTVAPAIRDFQQHLRNYNGTSDVNLDDHVGAYFTDITTLCTNLSAFYADIRIRRTGTTQVSVEYPQGSELPAPKLPGDKITLERYLHGLSAQIFFFIKDLGHRHQHHNPKTDTIVDLHLADDLDINWRKNTLYAMYRKVIDYKRIPHISTFNHCLGIIAYAKTFKGISKEELTNEETKNLLPVYYETETVDSIKATQSRVERDFSIRQRESDIFRTTTLTIFGTLFSLIGLMKVTDNVGKLPHNALLADLVGFIASHLEAAVPVVILLIWGTVRFQTRKYRSPNKLQVSVARVMMVLPRYIFAGVLLILSLAFTTIFLWVFFKTH